MKRQLDRLKGKRLVTGDPNLMTKDEICINATPNGVEVKEIGIDGKIKDLAGSGESNGNSSIQDNERLYFKPKQVDNFEPEAFELLKHVFKEFDCLCTSWLIDGVERVRHRYELPIGAWESNDLYNGMISAPKVGTYPIYSINDGTNIVTNINVKDNFYNLLRVFGIMFGDETAVINLFNTFYLEISKEEYENTEEPIIRPREITYEELKTLS